MFKRHMMKAALAVWVFSMTVSAGVAAAQDVSGKRAAAGKAELNADDVLDRLAAVMKVAGQPDKKRELLADAAKISSLRALTMAVAAAADNEVAKEALAAAGQIARALMAAQQPAYIRRSAFLRWVSCQPPQQSAKTVIDALRGSDVVLQSGALSVLRGRHDSVPLDSLTGQITSFPSTVQTGLIEVLAARGDGGAGALVEMARHKDKKVAAKAIAALGTLGGEKALAAIGKALADADGNVREAALRSLAGWADASPLGVLLGVVRKPDNEREKVLALRGMAGLALAGKVDKAAQAILLSALNLVAAAAAQGGAAEDAVVAAIQIGQALAASHPREVRQALDTFAACKLSGAARQHVRAARLVFTIDQLPNLARGAKASSPDGFDSDGPRPDAHAIDGDLATYWDETDGHALYRLRIDFAKPTDVSAISIAGWAHHSYSPRDFKIVCDGKTVRTVANATYANNRVIVGFPRTRCTSLELKITGYYGGSPGIRELGIFNAPEK